MSVRKKREEYRAAFAENLASNAMKYKFAVLRRVAFILRDFTSSDIAENQDKIIDLIMTKFNFPQSARRDILDTLRSYQEGVSDMWNQYFYEAGADVSMRSADIDKMMAAYAVDFPTIDSDVRDVIVDEIRKTARMQKGYENLRSRLMKRGLGIGESSTLANAALAQYDNAYMQEIAKQAGIEKYLYDGILHPSSRIFCKAHYGKVYTITEILGMDNGQGLPVLTSCGGYNCVHYWTPEID